MIRFDSDVYYLNTAGFIKVNAPSGSCTLNNGVVNTLTANIVSTTSTLSNVTLVKIMQTLASLPVSTK